MLKNMWRKSTWLFSTYVSAFCREKSRLEKSRVPSLSFFLLLASGESEEIRAVLENQFDLPRPLLPKHHAWKENDHFFLQKNRYKLWGIIFHCGMIFQFPISKQEYCWLVAENCVRDDPGFFLIFGAVLGGSLSYYPTNHPMWHSLRAPTSIFEQASIQKIQAFQLRFTGIGQDFRTESPKPEDSQLEERQGLRGYEPRLLNGDRPGNKFLILFRMLPKLGGVGVFWTFQFRLKYKSFWHSLFCKIDLILWRLDVRLYRTVSTQVVNWSATTSGTKAVPELLLMADAILKRSDKIYGSNCKRETWNTSDLLRYFGLGQMTSAELWGQMQCILYTYTFKTHW